jgi:hypothetical protein
MAAKKQRRRRKTAFPGLLEILEEATWRPAQPDSEPDLEERLALYRELFTGKLAVGPDGHPKIKRSRRGPLSKSNMWPSEPIANQIGFPGSYRHFGHSRVEVAVKDGLPPCVAEFIRRQVLVELSNAEKITEDLKTPLREREEKLSGLKVDRKELQEHERQLMKRPWHENIHWHLGKAQELRGLFEVCDSKMESPCRSRQFLNKAIKLTRGLKKDMSSKTAIRNIKLAELLKNIDFFKGEFPKKTNWEPKLEEYWRKKYRNSGLVKGHGVREHMASIVGGSKDSIAKQLSRAGFRLT